MQQVKRCVFALHQVKCIIVNISLSATIGAEVSLEGWGFGGGGGFEEVRALRGGPAAMQIVVSLPLFVER